ncbi:MAG: YtxH domain-containing protein [Peptostreptococcaceae bacterium]
MKNRKGRYLIFGAIFGFFIGLLFAPKKGRELREDIKETVNDIKENPKETVDNTISNIKEKLSDIVEFDTDNDVVISEEEIIISRSFDEEQ